MTFSLYLHIPFCSAKCDYCDFYSVPLGPLTAKERERIIFRYIDALLAETERRCAEIARGGGSGGGGGFKANSDYCPDGFKANADYYPAVVPTVYIGGGTPSLLGAAGITALMRGLEPLIAAGAGCSTNADYRPPSGCNANSDYRPPSPSGSNANARYPGEITVEANPESADGAFLEACAVNGINRISLGVQSFDGAARGAVGRRGGTALLPERLAAAAEIFGPGLSLDMMSGLPGQDRDVLLRDIDRALSFNPGHVSLYALTVEEGTRLAAVLSSPAGRGFPSKDEADELWLAGRDALRGAGFEHYEVSNFARRGPGQKSLRCAHNIRYWRMENWIGLGPGASGTVIGEDGRGRRVSYGPDADAFIADPEGPMVAEELDRAGVLRETFLMGFRYAEGPDPALFRKRFGLSVEEAIPAALEKWRALGDWEKRVLFLNRFLLDAFAELDNSRIT
ncbi:MAG: coproporphyrinogen III oxidase family protein [Treponema sp.]|jgi:oxygen-independent coproporphyrinogen-3 oxidase|nr:coproporphyrinogen III oxidase family protein [Treponema sp.]